MRRLKLGLLIFAAAFFAAACATATNTSTSIGNSNRTVVVNSGNSAATPAPRATGADDLASARATFNATCVNCHKENGEGGIAELDEGVRIKVPSFKTEHSIAHTDQQFARKIASGDKEAGMPAFQGRLTPEQINDLVRFIRREFQSSGPKEGPGHSDD
ncbi:MAG TPA: cytochrome c [Pyrinomonadaceae bacterium]|nr:cytochrome c [Pyrinomonadaceae bacterium]